VGQSRLLRGIPACRFLALVGPSRAERGIAGHFQWPAIDVFTIATVDMDPEKAIGKQ
jgi:hypothetical protein